MHFYRKEMKRKKKINNLISLNNKNAFNAIFVEILKDFNLFILSTLL